MHEKLFLAQSSGSGKIAIVISALSYLAVRCGAWEDVQTRLLMASGTSTQNSVKKTT